MPANMAPRTPIQGKRIRSSFANVHRPFALLAIGLAIGLAALSSTGVSRSEGQETTAVPNSNSSSENIQILAVVNGESVTRQELAQLCLEGNGQPVLEALVNRLLISSETKRQGIVVSRQEVYAEIKKIAAKWDLSTDQYLQMLSTQRGVEQKKYEEIVWTKISLQRLAASEINVSDAEVAQMLESQVGPQVQVRIIAIRDRARAEQVLELAKQDPSTFGSLAKDYSDDKNSAATRGMIPPIRRFTGDPEIEKVAFAMKKGEVSEIVEVPGQFVILLCVQHIVGKPINDQQRAEASLSIRDHLSEKKLAQAAGTMFRRLQEKIKIVNVYNDPKLSQQMPGVAALVGESRITIRELAEECISQHGKDRLETEINRKILTQHLKASGRTVSEEAIQEEVARAAISYGITHEDGSADINTWLESNTKDGTTIENYVRDVVWPTVALKTLVADHVQVTEEDLKKGFEANYGERVEVLAIVLQDQRTATKLWKMASGDPDMEFFGQLANEYSAESISKANFGRVPPIQRYGGRQRLEDEAFGLQKGELSGIVSVGSNWVILKCLGRTEPVVEDFAAVKDELYKDIREKKMRLAMFKTLDAIHASSQIDNFLTGSSQAGSGGTKSANASKKLGIQLPFANRTNR